MSRELEMSMTENMGPVAVLALNPAVDISYEIPQLLADQKVRAAKTYYHPGGNGINVARALVVLGVQVHCCSLIGGKGGELFLRLLGDELGDGHRYIQVDGETRINATLLQKQPPSQYEVDSGGPEISESELDAMIECFLERCADGLAVLTGSTPPGVPAGTYAELIENIRLQGGRVVLDAHGSVLEKALEAKPYLLRTNRYVLEMKVKYRLGSIEAVAQAAREIQRGGTEFVCISLGTEGAVLVDALALRNSREVNGKSIMGVLLLTVFLLFRRLWPVAISGVVAIIGVIWFMGLAVLLLAAITWQIKAILENARDDTRRETGLRWMYDNNPLM